MKPNALAIALVTAAATFPSTSHAADDVCSRLFIYAVNQLCQLLPNGQSLCQPVGLAGPSPSCESPSHPAMVQIPLGPPVIQIPQFPSFAPQPYAGNPLGINPFVPHPYAPAAAYFPNNGLPTLPYQAPMPNAATPQKLLPVTAGATTKPIADDPNKNTPQKSATAEVAAPTNLAGPEPATVPAAEATTAGSPASPAETATALPAPTPLEPIMVAPAPVSAPSAPAVSVTAPPVATTPDTPLPAAAATPEATPSASPAPVAATPDTPLPAVAATPEATPSANPASAEQAAIPVAPVSVDEAVRATTAAPISAEQSEHAAAAVTPAVPSTAAATTTPAVVGSQPAEPALPEKTVPSVEDALAHFEFDSAELTPVGRAMLDAWIKQASGNEPIVVTGHADRLGPEPYNEKLSLLRAEAVKNYLAAKGKTAKRIVILGKGEKAPLVECSGDATPETKSCLAPNRRAEITLKPVVKRARKVATKPARYPVAR